MRNSKKKYIAARVELRDASPIKDPDPKPKPKHVTAFTSLAKLAITDKRRNPRPPDPTPPEPKYARVEIAFSDKVSQMTAVAATRAIKNIVEDVAGASIRSMDSNVPDLRLDVFLVGHGYQADFYCEGQSEGSECRDFSGSYKGKQFYAMRAKLGAELIEAIERWKKGL